MLVTALTIVAVSCSSEGTTSGCGTIQQRVDGASSGATVDLPDGCVYREEVAIDKPITLVGGPGVEIRGSDVWTDWTESGEYWVSETSLDTFRTKTQIGDPSKKDICKEGTSRCIWPEQVFIDGEPLEQVESDPEPGQFAMDELDRRVILADDPADRTVEVTARNSWISGEESPDGMTVPDGVTVEGFTMKHAANGAQTGAIDNNDYSNWTIKDNELSDAHGVVVSLGGGAEGLKIEGNDIHHGGQMGVSGSRADLEVLDNKIHDNNTEDFEPSWAAGGMKIANSVRLVAEGNEIYDNDQTGIWTDTDAENVTLSNNRVYRNDKHGIRVEITEGAELSGNVLWENGWGGNGGAAISAANSRDVEIYDNTLAWNGNGVSVVDGCRVNKETGATYQVANVRVRDNTILAEDYAGRNQHLSLAWRKPGDCTEARIHDPASNNYGANNLYWYPSEEGIDTRFNWDGGLELLSEFNETGGEEGGRYLSDEEKEEAVEAEGIPAGPEPR